MKSMYINRKLIMTKTIITEAIFKWIKENNFSTLRDRASKKAPHYPHLTWTANTPLDTHVFKWKRDRPFPLDPHVKLKFNLNTLLRSLYSSKDVLRSTTMDITYISQTIKSPSKTLLDKQKEHEKGSEIVERQLFTSSKTG